MAFRNANFDVEAQALALLYQVLESKGEVAFSWDGSSFIVTQGGIMLGGKKGRSRSLATALGDVLGMERKTRKCVRCGVEKDLAEEFPKLPGVTHKGGADGRNRYCKECERKRVRAYEEKKRNLVTCRACKGEGEKRGSTCPECRGEGVVKTSSPESTADRPAHR